MFMRTRRSSDPLSQSMGHGVEGRTPQARLDAATAESVADTLSALTAPSRLLILGRLREGPASVTELTQAIGLEQSAISHQLRVLRSLGLVTRQRSGRSATYSLYDHHVPASSTRLSSTPSTSHGGAGSNNGANCLDRLGAFAFTGGEYPYHCRRL